MEQSFFTHPPTPIPPTPTPNQKVKGTRPNDRSPSIMVWDSRCDRKLGAGGDMRSVTVALDTPVSANQPTADAWSLDGEGMQLSLALP